MPTIGAAGQAQNGMALFLDIDQYTEKHLIMKTNATKNTAAQTKVLLKAIDMELKEILEHDVCKLYGDRRIQEAAFLQLIAA
jgi:hypothetical protein